MFIDVFTSSLLKNEGLHNVFIYHLRKSVVTFHMSVHHSMSSWTHNSRSSEIRVITELFVLPDEAVSMMEENVLY